MKPTIHLITKLKNFFAMQQKAHSGTFNLQNATAAQYHEMIREGNLPNFLSSNDRQRISDMYSAGKTFDAVRKLMGLVEAQNGRQGKSFV